MTVNVQFFSWFKDLTGSEKISETVPAGSTLGELYERLVVRFPRLAAMEKSTLMAIGVDYRTRDYILQDGDEVSLFPPVQGG